MDQKIVLLSILHFLSQKQSTITEDTLRHIRVILSLFNEEILSDDEIEQLVNVLRDEKFIIVRNGRVSVSREGTALVHAIGERLLGQTSFNRLEGMAQDYNQAPTKFIQNANEQLNRYQEIRKNKVKQVNKFLIRAVGFVIEIEHHCSELYVHRFRLDHQILRNEENLASEINYSVRNFMKSTGYPIDARRDGNVLEITGFTRISSFTLSAQDLTPFAINTIEREKLSDWDLLLASTFIENNLRELGYLRSRWPGRTFTKYQNFEQVKIGAGYIRESESLNIDFTELNGHQVFVWIESFTSPTKRVLDFLYENVSDLSNEQEILSSLSELKLRSIPSGSEVELKGIIPNQDLTIEQIPSTSQTFMNYWRKIYGIELTQTVQPILIVKGINNDFHYPAEMIYIDRVSLKRRLGASQTRKPKFESPKERFEKVQNLFYAIKDVYQDNWEPYCKVNLARYTPKIIELCELGAFNDAIQILPPILEFYGRTVSLDPLDVFSEGYGPICGPKNLSVTHVVLPDNRSGTDVDMLIKKLQRMFSIYRFGKIQKSNDIKILKYDPNADKRELEQKIRNLEKSKSDDNIAVAVVPGDDDELYYSLKRLLPRNTQVPLQIITKPSFEKILSGRFRGSENLSLQILIKSLKKGEAIWKLSNAAGLSKEKTLFVGLGFSRYPIQKKVSKCAAVLHDAHGDRITWEVFSTPQERTITKQWFDTLLFRIRDIIDQEKPSRLVFYRTGIMHDTELTAVENSLKERQWSPQIRVSFVSILEVGNFRFYLYDRKSNTYQNLPAGYAIVVNDKEAFLSSSNYDDRELRQGTVIPIRLRLEIGDENIIDILKEYHDLTYLNWPVPRTTAKHPLVITIADRFSELTRENVSTESMFYLDL